MTTTRDSLSEDLVGPLADLGLDLEEITVATAGRRRVVRVAVDRDGGVDHEVLAAAERVVSRVLEDTGVMGERPYVLELSSRGVDRPLLLPRHWRRNVGRSVRVRPIDGEAFTGRVVQAEEDAVVMDCEGSARRVSYAEVAKALVQIDFARRGEDD